MPQHGITLRFGLASCASVTDVDVPFVPYPAVLEGVELRIDHDETAGAGAFTMGLRFARSDAFASPLAPIVGRVGVFGHRGIGTAGALPEPGAAWVLTVGLVGLAGLCLLRRGRRSLHRGAG